MRDSNLRSVGQNRLRMLDVDLFGLTMRLSSRVYISLQILMSAQAIASISRRRRPGHIVNSNQSAPRARKRFSPTARYRPTARFRSYPSRELRFVICAC
jgi:hypothetical protein